MNIYVHVTRETKRSSVKKLDKVKIMSKNTHREQKFPSLLLAREKTRENT